MKRAQAVHRVASHDDFYLPSEKVLEMATIDAAKCVGMENEVGSLEVGKKADIITIDLINPRLMPRFNIIDTIVANGSPSDVDMVIVDGEILLQDGKAQRVDERKVLLQAEEEAIETVKLAGLDKFAWPSVPQWGRTKLYPDEVRFDLEASRRDGNYY